MKKEHEIIMLPSENTFGCIGIRQKDGMLQNLGHYNVEVNFNWEAQHLYILSDEEIKEGDWCIDIESNEVFQVDEISKGEEHKNQFDFRTPMIEVTRLLSHKNENAYKMSTCRKIIATTDTNINNSGLQNGKLYMKGIEGTKFEDVRPKQIPQHIIEAYVKKPFDKVMVEYDFFEGVGKDYGYDSEDMSIQKLNPDGTLAVSLVEHSDLNTYLRSRERILSSQANDSESPIQHQLEARNKLAEVRQTLKWIKENL